MSAIPLPPLGAPAATPFPISPTERVAVSVVVPCYNEEASLDAFAERMVAACRKAVGDDYEIVFINDGSRDRTWSVISALAEKYHGVVGVNLARNHGHQLAVTAGLIVTRGEQVMVIDADLQDPPELLEEMRARVAEGYDVVYGRRRSRAKESQFKLATAHMFYRLLDRLSDVEIPQDVGDFRLMTRRIVDRLNAMPEHDRFLRGMVAWLGGRQTEVQYDRDPRFAGETNYTLAKMLRLAIAGVTGFSTAPLNLAIVLAGFGTLIGFGLLLYVLGGYLFGHTVAGWTSLSLIVVFFGVGQFGCLAIMGAYVGRTYMQVKGRPLYLIDQVITSPAETKGRP